ncbi:SBBP repeat-containing protein [Pontibacter toksunensis]|uniref:SBBP repeat-containing protein n=1 Tax=Pontibacter toksunensis TaxID=1332631 RepID=A0ABW6BR53_9BACT
MKIFLLPSALLFLLYLVSTAAIAQQPTLEWAQRYNARSSTNDNVVAVAVDAEGNSYVTGNSFSTSQQMVTVKYSSSGEQLWAMHFRDHSNAIALDNAGGVYVTGNSAGGERGRGYTTIRYDAATGEEKWSRLYNGPANDYDLALAIGVEGGGVYVTGSVVSPGYSQDYATIRYDAATGEESWVQPYNGPANSNNVVPEIAIDNAGGVYVTGASGEKSSSDFVTIRYAAATGEEAWVRLYDEPASSENRAYGIAVGNGSIYVTGSSISGTTSDFATIRYEAATGEQIWVRRFDGTSASMSDTPVAVVVDAAGNSYVTGTSQGTLSKVTIVKYSPSGEQLWAVHFKDFTAATAIAVDNAGGVYVTGASSSSSSFLESDNALFAMMPQQGKRHGLSSTTAPATAMTSQQVSPSTMTGASM